MTARTVAAPLHLAFVLGFLLFVSAFVGCGATPRGAPTTEGIPNFGRVTTTLFRGAQPDEAGMAGLQRLGVRTVINLRLASDTWPAEEASARAHGLTYLAAPLAGLSAPTPAQVSQILALIESSPAPVFVHCQHGADRTGTIVACYRMQHDGWTVERAFAEAKLFGFSIFQIGMKHFIRKFSRTAPHSSPAPAPAL